MAKQFDTTPDRHTMRHNYEGLYDDAGEAISELLENGFDYRKIIHTATQPGAVSVMFEHKKNKLFRIIVADDAQGMDIDSMGAAMRIARQAQANGSSGAYGTGMKSSMDYLSAKPYLISKNNGKLVWAFQNPDKWEIIVNEEGDKGTKAIQHMWNEYAVNPRQCGTVVVLTDLKRNIDVQDFEKKLGWKYHQKVKQKNVNIYVGERNV